VQNQNLKPKINCLDRLVEWYIRKRRKQEETKYQTDEEKRRKEFVEKLQLTLQFIKWIDKQLENRRVKKTFWTEFIKDEKVRPETFEKLIKAYIQPIEKKTDEQPNTK